MPAGYTPYYMVLKGGVDVTSNFNDRCISIKVECVGGGGAYGDSLEIAFDDRDWAIGYPVVGDEIELHLGYKEVGMAYMGRFEINKVIFHGPPRTITIAGTSKGASSLLKAPTISDYSGKTLGDILKDLAQKGGLQAEISSELAGKQIPFRNIITSPNHFIHEMERMYGAVAKLQDGKLIFSPRDGGSNASGVTIPVIRLYPEHFGEWQVIHTERSSYGKTIARYMDPSTYLPTEVTHGNPISALGDKPEFRIGRLFKSKDEAQAAAEAQMGALNRSLGIGVFVLAKGDPWIRDQQRVLVAGMRSGISGSYVARSVVHTYRKDTGIQTVISADGDGEGVDYGTLFPANGSDNDAIDVKPGQTLGDAIKNTPQAAYPPGGV